MIAPCYKRNVAVPPLASPSRDVGRCIRTTTIPPDGTAYVPTKMATSSLSSKILLPLYIYPHPGAWEPLFQACDLPSTSPA